MRKRPQPFAGSQPSPAVLSPGASGSPGPGSGDEVAGTFNLKRSHRRLEAGTTRSRCGSCCGVRHLRPLEDGRPPRSGGQWLVQRGYISVEAMALILADGEQLPEAEVPTLTAA